MAEAACYALRILIHLLEQEGVLKQKGEYKHDPKGQYLGQTPGFEQGTVEPKIQKTGRVYKSDLLVALRDIQAPHDEDILAGAFVDTKDDDHAHPRIIIRISEEYAPHIAQAAINHIKKGLDALHRGAYNQKAGESIHPTTRRLIKQQVADLTDIRKAAERDLENISITEEDKQDKQGTTSSATH